MKINILRTLLIVTVALFNITNIAYSWDEHLDISHKELTGDYISEIIIKSKGSGGTGLYYEDIRIYNDEFPELTLIFQIRTLEKVTGTEASQHNTSSVVTFSEPNSQDGSLDIIVNTEVMYYKNYDDKVGEKTVLDAKIFKWNGKKYVESNKSEISVKRFNVKHDETVKE